MNLMKAMESRHSVRSYTDRAITGETLAELRRVIDKANADGGLNIQLVLNEPAAFDTKMAHYGSFEGVKNYIAMIGRRGDNLEERCGYYGERIVLAAQGLGLNTCWVALTYKRVDGFYTVANDEKLVLVIAIGYGKTQGTPHRSKEYNAVVRGSKNAPAWFKAGVEAALLAPTALNQQKFTFELVGDKVKARSKLAPCHNTDLGIVKYHFELGSGMGSDVWM
jgi:nitroreductase